MSAHFYLMASASTHLPIDYLHAQQAGICISDFNADL